MGTNILMCHIVYHSVVIGKMDYQQDGLYKQIDSTAIHLSPYLILQVLFLIYTRLVSCMPTIFHHGK